MDKADREELKTVIKVISCIIFFVVVLIFLVSPVRRAVINWDKYWNPPTQVEKGY